MIRTNRIIRDAVLGLVALIAVVVIAALVVVQTDWFRGYVRQQIISATESGTGGRVELGSFNFDVSNMLATVDDFVIHGKEPPGSPPFVRIARAEVQIQLLPGLRRWFGIRDINVDRPQANIMILADGHSNVPMPQRKSTSNKSALQTVVDLKIGHFQLTNGLVTLDSRKQPLNIQGNNVRVLLNWDPSLENYRGTLSMDPVYAVAGWNTPVNARITLPVTLGGDRIDIHNASISTPASRILIDGSIANLRDPKATAHVSGHLATADLKNAGGLPLAVDARETPAQIEIDATATAGRDTVQVPRLRIEVGKSSIDASGTLKGGERNSGLTFGARLAPGELGRVFGKTVKPDGLVDLSGRASMEARNVRLDDLRVAAFGARFDGSASLADFTSYKLKGDLSSIDIRTALRAFNERLPYDGVLSGTLAAAGDTRTPGTTSITAQVRMKIAPGRNGIPVSGFLDADYNGASDDIRIDHSFLALPHTRMTLDGSLGRKVNLALISRDLSDLLAAMPSKYPPPVRLNGGAVSFNGTLTGSLTAPDLAGHLAANRFTLEGRQFDSLAADVSASPSRAAIRKASLTRTGIHAATMRVQFEGSVGLRKRALAPRAPLSADLTIRNADLADMLALAAQPPEGYAGPLNAMAHIGGTAGNPQGTVTMNIGAGTIEGEPFNEANLQVSLTDQLVTIPIAYIQSGAGRMQFTAEYRHPRESFTTGTIHAHVQTSQLYLARIRTLPQTQPQTWGILLVTADVRG